MPTLYFRPFACSLASRIALCEAGIDATYRRVDIDTKRLVDGDGDFFAISAKGKVPVLELDDGSRLTENAAVLQYVADLRPDLRLAPPPTDPERYRLQEWLSFIGTELHKGFLNPTFLRDTPDAVRAHVRSRLPANLDVVAAHLDGRRHLLGERFSVADALLVWALFLIRFASVDLATWPALTAYLSRMQDRPKLREAVAAEQRLLQA